MTIRKIKRASQPTRVAFFDCETIGRHESRVKGAEMHRLRLGCMIGGRWRGGKLSGRKVFHFQTETEFLEALDSLLDPKQTLWLLAHNVGFDAQVSGLFAALKRGRYRILARSEASEPPPEGSIWAEQNPRSMVFHDPPTIIQMADGQGRKLVLLDSLNYCHVSLSQLGQAVGFPKLPMPKWSDPDKDWQFYCQRDVEILERWFTGFLGFVQEQDLGPVRWTASSQAMATYRYRHIPETIYSHQVEEVRKLERESYYGGQFRVFRLGEFSGDFKCCDVNSLFPSVMREGLFPVALERWCTDGPWRSSKPNFDAERSVAEVWIWSGDEDYPRRDKEAPYPATGYFRTVLAGKELARAIDDGHAIHWRKWAQYKVSDLFSTYVDELYGLRLKAQEEGREDYAQFCKLLLNSLYGKFGQRGSDLIFRPDARPPIEWGKWVEGSFDLMRRKEYQVAAGEAYELVDRKELRGSCPVVSSFIAAAARERMLELRRMLPDESIYYQAVDSFILDPIGYRVLESRGMIHPTELGKLKVSGESETLKIHGHGWYQIGERHVLPGRKQEIISENQAGYSQLAFEGLKSHFFREPDSGIAVRKRFVRFPDHFKRGTVDADGRVTCLHVIEEPSKWGLASSLIVEPGLNRVSN